MSHCCYIQVPEYIYPKDQVPDYSSILVPNVDNVRTDFLMQTIMKQGKAVLVIGEQGTAKTVMIKVNWFEFNLPVTTKMIEINICLTLLNWRQKLS